MFVINTTSKLHYNVMLYDLYDSLPLLHAHIRHMPHENVPPHTTSAEFEV